VFPLYYLPRDTQAAEELKTLLDYTKNIWNAELEKQEIIKAGESPEVIREYEQQIALALVDLEKATGFRFGGDRSLINQLNMLYDQLCRIYQDEDSDCLVAFPNYLRKGTVFEKELLQETVDMPFENITVKVPVGYDKILTKMYGDYMIPVKNAAGHKFIWFSQQVDVLSERLGVLDLLNKVGKKEVNADVTVMSSKQLDDFAEQAKEILPPDWWDKIYRIDGNGEVSRKKVVLYGTSLNGLLCHSEMVAEKLSYVFNVLKEQEDIVLWWFPYVLEGDATQTIKGMIPELLEEYNKMVKVYQEEDLGIYDDSGDIARALMMGDAYYGDEGLLFSCFRQTKKPIMCQNYDII